MSVSVTRPTLVVMAAGLGSRFGGLKQLEPVGADGEIILEYSVHDAVKAGFGRVVFIINEKIEAEFKERVSSRIPASVRCDFCIQDPNNIPAGVKVPPERKKPWGTGQAVMSLKGVVNEPFAVINADDYYGSEAYKLLYCFLTEQGSADGVSDYCMVGYGVANTLSENGTVARGICEIGEDGFLRGVTFHCERGDISTCKGAKRPKELEKWRETDLKDGDVKLYAPANGHWHEADFIDGIVENRAICSDAEIGHRTITCAHIANICEQLRTDRLDWDPVKEAFTGKFAAEANAMAEVKHHNGWELKA